MGGFVNEHAITISVRDSAALLDATAGCIQGDPYWAPPVARPFIQEVGADTGRLRIAYLSKAPGFRNRPCMEIASKAARGCGLTMLRVSDTSLRKLRRLWIGMPVPWLSW